MRRFVKRVLATASPSTMAFVQSYTQHAHIRRFERQLGLPALVSRISDRHGLTVQSGPFQGMSYLRTAVGSALLPKLLGTYEMELRSAVAEALARRPKHVIDIGCAEGYYAVGFAMQDKKCSVTAYDISPLARRACRKLAKQNGTELQVAVRGACTHRRLAQSIGADSLVICDCEGFEWQLLDPTTVESLAGADLLVELHRSGAAPVEHAFSDRFASTHQIEFITASGRDGSESELIAEWSEQERRLATDEMRSNGQVWAWAKSRRWLEHD